MNSPSVNSNRIKADVMKLVRSSHEVDMSDNINEFIVAFHGPADTPYAGGIWKVRVNLPERYPFKSPSIGFATRIYHPNIDEASGTVCLDVINQTWSPMYELTNVFDSFLPQLLTYPNPTDPLNNEAATLLIANKDKYDQKVKEYVERYASGNSPPIEETTAISTVADISTMLQAVVAAAASQPQIVSLPVLEAIANFMQDRLSSAETTAEFVRTIREAYTRIADLGFEPTPNGVGTTISSTQTVNLGFEPTTNGVGTTISSTQAVNRSSQTSNSLQANGSSYANGNFESSVNGSISDQEEDTSLVQSTIPDSPESPFPEENEDNESVVSAVYRYGDVAGVEYDDCFGMYYNDFELSDDELDIINLRNNDDDLDGLIFDEFSDNSLTSSERSMVTVNNHVNTFRVQRSADAILSNCSIDVWSSTNANLFNSQSNKLYIEKIFDQSTTTSSEPSLKENGASDASVKPESNNLSKQSFYMSEISLITQPLTEQSASSTMTDTVDSTCPLEDDEQSDYSPDVKTWTFTSAIERTLLRDWKLAKTDAYERIKRMNAQMNFSQIRRRCLVLPSRPEVSDESEMSEFDER